MPNVMWIDGELAEIVRLDRARAKIIYLTCEAEGRLPTEVRYAPEHFHRRRWRKRVVLQDSNVLLIERVKPRFVQPLDFRKLARQVLAKLGLNRTHD